MKRTDRPEGRLGSGIVYNGVFPLVQLFSLATLAVLFSWRKANVSVPICLASNKVDEE